MKRFLAALVAMLALLALAGRFSLDAAAVRASARAEFEYDRSMKRDILALMLAYPDDIAGVRREEDGLVYIVMHSSDEVMYDDGREKGFDEQLWNADVQDMMAMAYPLGAVETLRQGNDDPGRVRCYALLHALYGGTQRDIESNLVSVGLVSGRYSFASQGADAAEAAMQEVAALASQDNSVYGCVFPLNGTYNYRVIAGTSTLSAHAFGIALDFCSHSGDYWRWSSREAGQARLDAFPQCVVDAMENHGFIWGGKWAHFDFLHFEYRPELILKARCTSEAEPWYSGFPQDAQTREAIVLIEDALG